MNSTIENLLLCALSMDYCVNPVLAKIGFELINWRTLALLWLFIIPLIALLGWLSYRRYQRRLTRQHISKPLITNVIESNL